MSSADFTNLHPWYWNSLLYSLMSSGENSVHFLHLMLFTIITVFIPPGTHHCWVDRGMVWEVLSNTSTHYITSVIWWELVNLLCATICVWDCEANRLFCYGFCGSWNVHLGAPLLMHTWVQPLLAVCSAVCDAALSPHGNECRVFPHLVITNKLGTLPCEFMYFGSSYYMKALVDWTPSVYIYVMPWAQLKSNSD